ncbi:MAG: hypothetical protein E6H53_19085 [Betaproteobacteria bacterium]|nr:MAG: hypothetical protein E6H53_19085 [Betaproteobacteria bacterium]
MSKRVIGFVLMIGTVAFVAAPSLAADDAATRKDLTAVIALQGLPCGEVISVKTQGDNDHIATCKNGNRYHVFLNSTGRVVVEKQ